MRDFSLNFSQVGMVAVSAVRLKRKTLPLGINEWPKEVIQQKLLDVVTCANVDVEVISKALRTSDQTKQILVQSAVAYIEHLPEGINSVISLQNLDQGKRWLQLLLSAPQCIEQWNDQALADLLQLLGIHQVDLKRKKHLIVVKEKLTKNVSVKVDMRWSSKQKKNYLHLAAERGLPKVLRLLLERARFHKTIVSSSSVSFGMVDS